MTPQQFIKAQKKLGFTSQQFADALGVTLATIAKRRAGDTPIKRETELAIKWLTMEAGC